MVARPAAVIAPPSTATLDESPEPKVTATGTAAITVATVNPSCTEDVVGPSSGATKAIRMNIQRRRGTRIPQNLSVGRAQPRLNRIFGHTNEVLERVTGVIIGEDVGDLSRVSQPSGARVVPETFDSFYAGESRPLVGLAYALSGSRLAADDIAQEALLAAFRRWEEVSNLDNPGAWVRRVVANKSVSLLRRRISEAKVLTRLALHRPVAIVPDMEADSEWLWLEVRRLPRRQVQIIALRYYDQLSLSEIAETLGCSKEAVNTHLRRARETLSRRLGSSGELP
jgi:RNA polymerase sigma-70 factor (ECF subfamily)